MIQDSPLVVGHDSPRLGTVSAELQQILPAVYPAVIIGLALRALDTARDEGACSATVYRAGWDGSAGH